MNNKPICFFHSADFDGICSFGIVRKFYKNNVEGFPINYGDSYDINIVKGREVIICDFSFDVPVFEKIVKMASKVIFLDHHKTAIEKIVAAPFYKDMLGIQSTDFSGCELTWKYFFKDKEMPKAVNIIGLYDTFRFKEDEKEECFNFQYGLKVLGLDQYFNDAFKNNIWNELLKNYADEEIDMYAKSFQSQQSELIESILKNGSTINKYYINHLNKELNSRSGRTVRLTVDGKNYTAYIINAPMIFSDTFKHGYDEKMHDICIPYYQNAAGKWSYSIYVQSDKNIDGSSISKHFGGGGHKKASGFITDTLLKEFQ